MRASPTIVSGGAQPSGMTCVELTLPTPQANLDLDAARLHQADQAAESDHHGESLRVWECPQYCVVLGHASRQAQDVRRGACARAAVPVLRRISGGGTVLLGPGCLNFSLILSLARRPALRAVSDSMNIILAALTRGLGLPGVRRAGVADLVWRGRKFSGNAQRRGRRVLLHHGTILYDFDIARVGEFLREPLRQPAYRRQRRHHQFLGNIPFDGQQIRQALARAADSFD